MKSKEVCFRLGGMRAKCMKAPKTVYVCTECDYQSPRWLGKCPSCGAWNSFTEETYTKAPASDSAVVRSTPPDHAVKFSEYEETKMSRISTTIGEFDRVLGGGIVDGSVVLLAGEPGIGKSTLLMQLCGRLGNELTLLYVSGEESKSQLKLRASRLSVADSDMLVLTETNIDDVIAEYDRIHPSVMIIDSIQTMYSPRSTSAPGSINQVRECANALIGRAKADGAAVIIVGHVNKEGGIAGPKVLEHMVDAVLYFEGDKSHSHRIIRSIKNRYGSTNEIGVFEMTDSGLAEVDNPSAMLLAGRPRNVSGSCAVCVMEGTRPIIAEIQALVTQTVFPAPRRMADGIDYNRMCLLLAVLEKRLGLRFSSCDVYLNVVGGLKLDEPGVDAAVALALISSMRNIAVPQEMIAIGEIGLSGEFRTVSSVEQRIKEAARLGFTKIAVPKRSVTKTTALPDSIELCPLAGIYDALKLLNQSGIAEKTPE